MRHTLLYIIAAVMTLGIASCNHAKSYDRYYSTDVEGWDREDSLDFNVGKLTPGTYHLLIGFKATTDYPYKDISFNINWTDHPSEKTHTKKIKCDIYDDEGRMRISNGISASDFLFNVDDVKVSANDSLTFNITHNMNLGIIPGITAVGIQLVKE